MSLTSDDDEYHYSDLEQDEEEDEYQYSEDDNDAASVTSSDATGQRASAKAHHLSDSSRLSPLGASSGSAAKKKRMSAASLDASAAQAGRHEDYRVIDEEELFVEMRSLIQEIAQVLEIPFSQAAILLRHFGWNKEKLFEGYYLDPAKAKEEAGLEFAGKSSPTFASGVEVRLASRLERLEGRRGC